MTQAVVSFRSVPKILNLFQRTTLATLHWIPHFTSVINWTQRLGLAMLDQVSPITTPWFAIIDLSIDVGVKKALVVLRVPAESLKQRGSAVCLEDCECIGLKIMEKVNGETISAELTDIFATAGMPVAVVKDGGTDLKKGIRLWHEAQNQSEKIYQIEDIGHFMSNALQAAFSSQKRYHRFVKIASTGAARLRQTKLAFLVPPKLRAKGRFQSIGKLGQWAEKILQVFSKKGLAANGSTLQKLRIAMGGLSLLKPFLLRFASTLKIVSQVWEILKKEGLTQSTYNQSKNLAEQLPKRSKVKSRLLGWLDRHIEVQSSLQIEHPLLVSSDIIESLFGKFKYIIERSPQADMGLSALVLPALCGKINGVVIDLAIKNTVHRDLKVWEQKNIPYTLRKQRMAFFSE